MKIHNINNSRIILNIFIIGVILLACITFAIKLDAFELFKELLSTVEFWEIDELIVLPPVITVYDYAAANEVHQAWMEGFQSCVINLFNETSDSGTPIHQ